MLDLTKKPASAALQIAGSCLCEVVDLRACERVLDFAARKVTPRVQLAR